MAKNAKDVATMKLFKVMSKNIAILAKRLDKTEKSLEKLSAKAKKPAKKKKAKTNE